jgi:polyhydroxybutyrate depolymerase
MHSRSGNRRVPAPRAVALAAAIAVAFLTSACGRGITVGDASSQDRHLEVDGLRREYRLDLPSAALAPAQDGRRVRMIVALHGGGGTPNNLARNTRLGKRGPAAGFAVAYPKGVHRGWNAGFCCGPAAEQGIDDIGFIDAMLADIGRNFPVNADRVSALGFSNGGALAYLLACRRSERFDAIVVSGSALPPDTPCNPAQPVSILHFHGTADHFHPYHGGPSESKQPHGAILRSAPGTIREWATLDRCPESSRTSYERGAARCREQSPCGDTTQVVFCTIEGMGHQWPGAAPILPAVLGPGSDDLDATGMALEFVRTGGRAP